LFSGQNVKEPAMQPRTRRFHTAYILLAVATLCAAPALGADEAKAPATGGDKEETVNPLVQAARNNEKKDSGVTVYSNEDLQRLYGGGSLKTDEPETASGEGTLPTTPTEPDYDPLKQMLEQQGQAKQRDKDIVEATAKVSDAKQRITDLEKRILATKNPLLARPAPPEEGADEWNAMSAPERVDRSKQDLEAARTQLAEAEAELDRLRRSP